MARKFVTINCHSGDDWLNADWAWHDCDKALIQIFLREHNYPHASLSVSPFVTPIWMFGNKNYGGGLDPLRKGEIEIFKDFLRKGGGLVYYESFYPIGFNWRPGLKPDEKEGNVTYTIEEIINANCIRLTERFHLFTGEHDPDSEGKRLYGVDALHKYIGDIGTEQITGVTNAMGVDQLIAEFLCGIERVEYAGPCPGGPNVFSADVWLDLYLEEFAETPFYWICGLQSFITFHIHGNNLTPNQQLFDLDISGRNWASVTPEERVLFSLRWLNEVGEVAPYRMGAYYMIKGLRGQKLTSWQGSLRPNWEDTEWRDFLIETQKVPYSPSDLSQAHLNDANRSSDAGRYGSFKNYIRDFMVALKEYLKIHDNIIPMSDQESKKMIYQQYPKGTAEPITVDHTRIMKIAEYLADTDNWQNQVYEWGIAVTRPPNCVKIILSGGEVEYYTLSEAWWLLFYAIYTIAQGAAEIPTIDLQFTLGPCEPSVLYPIKLGSEEDSIFRINKWWQHEEYRDFVIKWKDIKKTIRSSFNAAKSQPVGPTYPTSRQVELRKVITFLPLDDEGGTRIQANAAETLFVMAKGLMNWSINPELPAAVSFKPSHVLAKNFKLALANNLYQYPFAPYPTVTRQMLWLGYGQTWTIKPAVLKPEFR